MDEELRRAGMEARGMEIGKGLGRTRTCGFLRLEVREARRFDAMSDAEDIQRRKPRLWSPKGGLNVKKS